jgi:hypothetical protein
MVVPPVVQIAGHPTYQMIGRFLERGRPHEWRREAGLTARDRRPKFPRQHPPKTMFF